MDSLNLILSFLISGVLEITIPIALAIYAAKRLKGHVVTFLVGGVLFLLSLVRIPLNTVVIDWRRHGVHRHRHNSPFPKLV